MNSMKSLLEIVNDKRQLTIYEKIVAEHKNLREDTSDTFEKLFSQLAEQVLHENDTYNQLKGKSWQELTSIVKSNINNLSGQAKNAVVNSFKNIKTAAPKIAKMALPIIAAGVMMAGNAEASDRERIGADMGKTLQQLYQELEQRQQASQTDRDSRMAAINANTENMRKWNNSFKQAVEQATDNDSHLTLKVNAALPSDFIPKAVEAGIDPQEIGKQLGTLSKEMTLERLRGVAADAISNSNNNNTSDSQSKGVEDDIPRVQIQNAADELGDLRARLERMNQNLRARADAVNQSLDDLGRSLGSNR